MKYTDRVCQWCGSFYTPHSGKGRFCSNRCRCAWNANKRRIIKLYECTVNTVYLMCARLEVDADDPVLIEALSAIWVSVDNAMEILRGEK